MVFDHADPINLGQDRMISVNEQVDIVAAIAGKRITKQYDRTKPQRVRGRNSDNSTLRKALGREPQVSIENGRAQTCPWISQQLVQEGRPVPGGAPR